MTDPHAASESSGSRTPASIAVVPDHELIRLIGKGSYGEVWLGRNTLGGYRAIKIVYENSFRNKRPFEREFNGVQKFEPVSRLHDGLMDVLQVGRNDAAGYFYCVMELADDIRSGQVIDPGSYTPRTLAQDITRQKRLPVQDCRRIGIAIASALDFLHGRGLIHRDVKPSNIVFINGIPKLADIGLVAETAEARSYVGTEGFIPPEGPGTARADIYSFGKVLYEISTGKDRHDYPELPAELNDTIQEDELFAFNRVVMKACRADPRERYPSAKHMATELFLLQADRRPRGGRPMARVLVLILVLAAAAYLVAHQRPAANHAIQSSSSNSPPVAASNPVSLTTGLISYWAGDDDTVDSAGPNDGQALGGLKYAPGQVGRAFLFDGTNAGVKIEAAPDLDVGAGAGLTLVAWINPVDVSKRGPLFEWNDSNGSWGLHFQIDPHWHSNEIRPGALYANLEDTNHHWHQMISAAGVLVNNEFQHVALTYDKRMGVATIYCNGEVVAREDFGPFTSLCRHDLYLGRRVSSEAPDDVFTFAGLMDEPAVFNRALSQDEIQDIWNAGRTGESLLRPRGTPSPLDLVGTWQAESNGLDSIGGNHGELMSGAGYAAGKVGQAFSFTGSTNSYIRVPDSPSLRLTNQLTIEAWVRRQRPFASDYLINKGGSWVRQTVNYGFAIANPRSLNMLVFAFAGGNRGVAGIDDSRWHHCAVTVRNGDRDATFYVDGVQRPVIDRKGEPLIRLNSSADPLIIGAEIDLPGGWSYYSRALVDELSIYSRILSAAEIEAIYRAGRAGKLIEPGNTQAQAHPH